MSDLTKGNIIQSNKNEKLAEKNLVRTWLTLVGMAITPSYTAKHLSKLPAPPTEQVDFANGMSTYNSVLQNQIL